MVAFWVRKHKQIQILRGEVRIINQINNFFIYFRIQTVNPSMNLLPVLYFSTEIIILHLSMDKTEKIQSPVETLHSVDGG